MPPHPSAVAHPPVPLSQVGPMVQDHEVLVFAPAAGMDVVELRLILPEPEALVLLVLGHQMALVLVLVV